MITNIYTATRAKTTTTKTNKTTTIKQQQRIKTNKQTNKYCVKVQFGNNYYKLLTSQIAEPLIWETSIRNCCYPP